MVFDEGSGDIEDGENGVLTLVDDVVGEDEKGSEIRVGATRGSSAAKGERERANPDPEPETVPAEGVTTTPSRSITLLLSPRLFLHELLSLGVAE